jgi:hypothetical protein
MGFVVKAEALEQVLLRKVIVFGGEEIGARQSQLCFF